MFSPISCLRQSYPWPSRKPNVPSRDHGWFNGAKVFRQFTGPDVRVYLELGTWLGKSALWFAEQCPGAQIICIDHWEGSSEHHKAPYRKFLPTLYETFLVNAWPHRDRMIPIRATTLEGLEIVASHGVAVDLLYVDASHDATNVAQDLTKALDLFPSAQIFGDDWRYPGVQEGVRTALRWHGKLDHLRPAGKVWWLQDPRRRK